MKKALIGILFCTLFLTGCGEKTLTCRGTSDGGTTTPDGDIVEFLWDDEYKFTFDKISNKVIKVEEKTDAIFFDVSKIDVVEQQLNDEYSGFTGMGMDIDISRNDNRINIKVSYEVSNLNDELKEEITYVNQTYKEIKTYFEEDGYTCK